MEDKSPSKQDSNEDFGEHMMKTIRNMAGLKQKAALPNFPINKKIQNKLLKEKKNKNIINNKKTEEISKEDKQEIIKKVVYPSGIIKIITKNGKNQIINEEVDYKDIKENYINNIKENLDKELIKLIENSFLLYNRRDIIRNIVKKPYSTKILEEKILLWKYYIKNLNKDEKALLIRKLLYYIGKFSEKIYKEFINFKEISKAYNIFSEKGKIEKDENERNKSFNAQRFYTISNFFRYDADGNPQEEKNELPYREEMKAMLLSQHQILNIKNELNGTGYGYVFLKELKEIGDMYTNSSYIFNSIFSECYEIFDKNYSFLYDNVQTYRILWNFYVDYFIDDSFIMNFLIELKWIFGSYKQNEVIKYMHNLVLYRWNVYDVLKKIKEYLEKLLGPEEIYDEKEKVDKMNNIDDVMKYIEGEEKPKKKKKKKKKKNENKINIINEIGDDKEEENNDNYDEIDIDDSISIISEADSVLDCFKNDLIEETEFNNGNKIIPQLSKEFLKQFQ